MDQESIYHLLLFVISFRAGWPRDLMKHQGMDRLMHRVTNLGLQ